MYLFKSKRHSLMLNFDCRDGLGKFKKYSKKTIDCIFCKLRVLLLDRLVCIFIYQSCI